MTIGISIAFAVSEKLISSTAFTMFATHFPQLTSLATLYPNVKNIHLKTTINILAPIHERGSTGLATRAGRLLPSPSDPTSTDNTTNNNCRIKFLHEVGLGPCDMQSGYGILMAEMCGFPSDILAHAKVLRGKINEEHSFQLNYKSMHMTEEDRLVNRLLFHLVIVLQDATMDDARLRAYLHNLRSSYSDAMVEIILKKIASVIN